MCCSPGRDVATAAPNDSTAGTPASSVFRGTRSIPYGAASSLDGNVKTIYIYVMSSRLVNVRLDARRLERTRRLRASGITLSDLVRDAIDRRYEQLVKSSRRRDVEAIMNEIYEGNPDPADLAGREYDVHVGAEAREAVRRKLRSKDS